MKVSHILLVCLAVVSICASPDRQRLFQKLYATEMESAPNAPAPLGTSVIDKTVELEKINGLIRSKLEGAFKDWVQVFAKDFGIAKVAMGVKFHKFDGVNKYWQSEDAIDIPIEWRFAVKWPWIKKLQYLGATSIVWVRREMGPNENEVTLYPELRLGLGKNWQPDPEQIAFLTRGFSRKYVNKVIRFMLTKGIERTFKLWGKAANKALAEKLGPKLPPVNGEPQELQVLSVSSHKDMVTARFSGLVLNLKTLLKAQIPADTYDRITITDFKSGPESLKVIMDMFILETPTNITATPGDSQITINFDGVDGANSYNLYYSTSPFMAPSTKVEGVTSPYVLSGLTNGTMYYFSLTSMDTIGESGFSPTANSTPVAAEESNPPSEEEGEQAQETQNPADGNGENTGEQQADPSQGPSNPAE